MTSLILSVNVGDSDVAYGESGAEYIDLDLINDFLIWTAGDDTVKDGMIDVPSQTQLTNASPIIPLLGESDLIVPLCLLMDYSAETGEPHLLEIQGMAENAQYVFAFRFDGATATEPQLEVWDDDTMLTIEKYVLGGSEDTPHENPEDSMVKAVCTTIALPSEGWLGTAIAGDGSTRVVGLNGGLAITEVDGKDLYANIKIVIPANFSHPAIETFSLVIRYTWI